MVMERILTWKIVNAYLFDGKYLKAVWTKNTNKIYKIIPEIFNCLFDTYVNVRTQDVMGLCQKIENLHFGPIEPVDTIITEIEDYVNIMDSIDDAITEAQKYQLVYMVLQNTE